MSNYEFDTPEKAYKKAQQAIENAADTSSTELRLGKFGFKNVPPEIAQLTNLTQLYLYGNRLTEIPTEITELPNLRVIRLDQNQITDISLNINQLTHTTHLNLSGNKLTNIPSEFSQLSSLQVLRLSNNQLTTFPFEISKLTNLQVLDLQGNLLTLIFREIAQLSNLQVLSLQNNHISTLPTEITTIKGLKKLELQGNKLEQFPLEITKLINLEQLFLNDNRLTTIPSEIAQIKNLREFFLSNNHLTTIPSEVVQLTNLRKFYLDGNPDLSSIPAEIISAKNNAQSILSYLRALSRIKEANDASLDELNLDELSLIRIPPEIAQLTDLKVLSLQKNQLTTIPLEIAQLTKLRQLYLQNNKLTTVPSEIANLIHLEQLFLNNNKITAIPPETAQLRSLQILDAHDNQLTSIPIEITQLTKLKKIDLHGNKLESIPPEMSQLTKLFVLDAHDNQLTSIPTEISKLINLQLLDLHSNQLTAIPIQITQLKNLKRLYLQNNQLTTIPLEITRLINLERLLLHNNQLKTISPEIVQLKNLQELTVFGNPELSYREIPDILASINKQETRSINEAKLIVVGQGNVGKTSLIKRLLGKAFDEDEGQTKGIRIENWKLIVDRPVQGPVDIDLNIWDFGGQEIMHATHQFFLTDRSLYLLVLDARQEEDDGILEYWLSLINSFAASAPILIIINKIDQQFIGINQRGLQKKYPSIIGVVPTSALTGEGVDLLKTKITSILAEMPHIDTPFPASWQRTKEALVDMQATRHFLYYSEYETICQECGVDEESAQHILVRFLHDLGIVLNFQDDPRVRETSVLNPHWVTDGVYTILNDHALQKQKGILYRAQLNEILPSDKYPISQHRFLLDMMRKFELAYEMDWDKLLVPDLIATEEPEFEWDDEEALQFAYQYHILPRSILHRFMVRQYHLVDSKIRWRTGVMLRYDGLSALVKADIKAGTIRIAINGDGDRRQFLYSLRLSFAGIHESITGIQPKEVVLIPGHPEAPPLLYSYLEKLEAMNMPDEQLFPGMDEIFSVQQLLNGVTTSAMRQSGLPTRGQIRDALRTNFDKSDFYALLFELKVARDDLVGESVNDQKQECVLYMERNGRLAELVEAMRAERPNLDFRSR